MVATPTVITVAPVPADDDEPGDVTTIVDERYQPAPGEVVQVTVLSVPASDRYPDGIKYAFHYGPTDGTTTYLRYDNAHGVHEMHVHDDTTELDPFPGVGPLLRRFREEVDL